MKKMLLLSLLLLGGCKDVPVDEKGDLADYSFKGRWHGINFYEVTLKNYSSVYVGVKEDEIVLINQPNGKVRINTIFINGQPVSVEKAKEILEKQ